MNTAYDIIIVGGGGSGLAAAVSAAEHGASVLVLEKQPQLGGTTGIAVGSFTANRTRMQQLLPANGPIASLMGRLTPLMPAWVMTRLIRRLLVTWQHPENALFDDGAILVNTRGERFCDETG